MKKKLYITLVVVLCSFCSIIGLAFAKGSIKIVVNDQIITSDVAPQMVNNRVMVPISVISKALGANVNWDQKNQTITINNNNRSNQNDIWNQELELSSSSWAGVKNLIGTYMIGFDERDDKLIRSVTVEGFDMIPIGGMYPAIIDYTIVDAQHIKNSLKVRVKVILSEDELKGQMWDFVITKGKIESMRMVQHFDVDQYTVFPGLTYIE
ncbi:copper amine oxidase N-terminal domain-containing protein [Paenibacillus gallinarum]|uniref:Copper amine oxidase N-terminal domain-containing protein n=1 Tax=Paenibacillus gallinarum TaxID=2762232 RepID=A0ABR8T0Z6_9BACL|nr:copper amine oxidase N-terminal domain-containing protein [Paenibacillus gallinarum]MBD7969436.1 copper amine oxidase N-terminal domain-containing protein [Paenibacillus gallinarum]